MEYKKEYIKFIFRYFIELITQNLGKSILVALLVILYHFAGTFERTDKKTKIESEIKVTNGYVYIYYKNDEYDLYHYDKKMELDSDGYLHTSEYNDANALLWIAFFVALITLVVIMLEHEWELDYVKERAIASIVHCEIEDNKYVYTCMGKLLGKIDLNNNRPRSINNAFNIYNISDVMLCPNYKTKSAKREDLLNKLGINEKQE